MFYALATRKVDTGDLRYEHTLSDIETLNRRAMNGGGEYEVSAISCHAYAYLAARYALLACGGSVGRNYGPVLVARRPLETEKLATSRVVIPGAMTTAALVLRLFCPDVRADAVPFDAILDRVADGEFDAGLVIHEGQLTYREMGLHKVLDLGEWWQQAMGLPLPLGCNVVRRDLGMPLMKRISADIRASIRYALEHREAAMEYAMSFARGLDSSRADRFVGMYVNDLTLDYGPEGRRAIRTLLTEAHRNGLAPEVPDIGFV